MVRHISMATWPACKAPLRQLARRVSASGRAMQMAAEAVDEWKKTAHRTHGASGSRPRIWDDRHAAGVFSAAKSLKEAAGTPSPAFGREELGRPAWAHVRSGLNGKGVRVHLFPDARLVTGPAGCALAPGNQPNRDGNRVR